MWIVNHLITEQGYYLLTQPANGHNLSRVTLWRKEESVSTGWYNVDKGRAASLSEGRALTKGYKERRAIAARMMKGAQ